MNTIQEKENFCPCGSEKSAEDCCLTIIRGKKVASTPEEMMRARYSAHALGEIPFLMETVHPAKRSEHDENAVRKWSKESDWLQLEILKSETEGDKGTVEFIAHYRTKGERKQHHELAEFHKKSDKWYFWDGKAPQITTYRRTEARVGRNEPCPCGSGKKFKKCCGK